ncbi:MAG: extensin family protein [Acidimicrobiia bacterium]|nr:extensin family protein [Acidimicrobiia bacterium]
MSKHYCDGKLVDIVSRNTIGGQELRGRSFLPDPGIQTSFGNFHSLEFNTGFYDQCNRWASNMDWWFYYNSPYSDGTLDTDWYGEVGVKACHRITSAHNRARGFDLCQIRFSNGWLMDSNWSPTRGDGSLHVRRYLGVAANLRRYFGTVLTAWYNNDHRDHIHFDDLTSVQKIRTNTRSDTTLVQAAAKHLNGESLSIDGDWGPVTGAAYTRLISKFGLTCYSPTSNTTDGKRFLYMVIRHAIANKPAGTYKYSSRVCGPS